MSKLNNVTNFGYEQVNFTFSTNKQACVSFDVYLVQN